MSRFKLKSTLPDLKVRIAQRDAEIAELQREAMHWAATAHKRFRRGLWAGIAAGVAGSTAFWLVLR